MQSFVLHRGAYILICVLLCNSFYSAYTKEHQSVKDLKIQTDLKTAFRNNTFSSQIITTIAAWKMTAWYLTNKTKVAFGGGFTGPYATVGIFYPYGDYRIFADASTVFAWSLLHNQRFFWKLQYPSFSAPFGMKVSYKPLDVWSAIYDVREKMPTYSVGAALGHKFKIYEPRFMYQYSFKEQFNLSSSEVSSWYLTRPTSLSVHNVSVIQRLYLNTIFVKLVGKMSVPETIRLAGGGSALLRMSIDPITIAFYAQGVSPHYVTDTLKYQKNLWSHSGEVLLRYKRNSFLRGRYHIEEPNPLKDTSNISGKSSIDRSLYQLYEVKWKHAIEKENIDNYIELLYSFYSLYKRHVSNVSYSLLFSDISFSSNISLQWYYLETPVEEWGRLRKVTSSIGLQIGKKKIFQKFNFDFRSKIYLLLYNKDEKLNQEVFEQITLTPSITMNNTPIFFRFAFPVVYVAKKQELSVSVEFSMRYTSK